ncbi:MAG TPA: LytTR family DNA-binding domain-containing protein [Bacteroidales bacterium]|nr:LytTR family DNA-binding domain-containing protein [Bacteroidales bacterium]
MKQFWIKQKYPQNFIIKRPAIGAAILFVFSFGFTLMYHPLNTHESLYFGFELTMLIYALISSAFAGVFVVLLKQIPVFAKIEKWTFGKEIASIYIVLQMIGIVIYFLAFVMEPTSENSRWNFQTFFDSSLRTFLIFIFPFLFFSISNYKFLFLNFESSVKRFQDDNQQAHTVQIRSRLKKESLTFQANDLLFAVSEGNYVVFNVFAGGKLKKSPIRNSISDIENQLKHIPFMFRSHRGFIVNLNRVESKKGNASGYLLKIKHVSDVIPVSRNKVDAFNHIMESPKKQGLLN